MISLANNLRSFLPAPRASATPGPLDPFWYQPAQAPGPSGIVVKPDNGLKVGPAYACIRVLRECIGSLPWEVFERVPGEDGNTDARLDPDHYLAPILARKPNAWQTILEFKELIVSHLCLRGNFYAHIVPSPDQEFALKPLNPDKMQVDQLPDDTLKYTYAPKPGLKYIYPASEIFHVRGLTLNSVTGVSVLEYASLTVGLSIAQQTHGASLFRNGGLPTFWIKRPQGAKWTKDAIRNFRSGWKKLHAGPENAGNPPILQDGMELHELGLSNRDSQWLESLDFNAIDICRFFGVPPHMIGIHGDEAANIEQTGIEFVRFTLHPLACRLEQAADRDLILDPEKHYSRFDLDELQRGDMLNRYQAHNIGVQGGWKLANEARREERYNPIEGGSTPRFPLNMQPAGGGPDWNEQGGQPGNGKKKKKKKKLVDQDPEEADDLPGGRKDDDGSAMDDAKSYARLRASLEPVVDDAAQRIAACEIRTLSSRAEKAEADRDRYLTWAAEFYAGERRQLVTKTLAPITSALKIALGAETVLPESLFGLPAALTAAAMISRLLTIWDAPVQVRQLASTVRGEQIAAQLRAVFFAGDPDQARDKDGKFASGGGGGEKQKTKEKSKASQTKADRAKAAYSPATKEKQDQGDLRQRDVAKILAHVVSDDNAAMDVLGKDKDGKNTAVEVKTLCDAKNDKLTMRKECRERKQAFGKAEKSTLYTVAVDDRDTFEGGKHKARFAGSRYRMSEGVGSFRLSNMTPVTPKEMKAVVRGERKLADVAAKKKED